MSDPLGVISMCITYCFSNAYILVFSSCITFVSLYPCMRANPTTL
nr:MAG TPA: hypothetical protein [Caudoviricetes sp.]